MPSAAKRKTLIEFIAVQATRSRRHFMGMEHAQWDSILTETQNYCRNKPAKRRFATRMAKLGIDPSMSPEKMAELVQAAIARGDDTGIDWKLRMTFRELPKLQAELEKMNWVPIPAKRDRPAFITTDDPVRLTSELPNAILRDVRHESATIFFPVSPHLCLMGLRDPTKRQPDKLPVEMVARINELALQGASQCFSSSSHFISMQEGRPRKAEPTPEYMAEAKAELEAYRAKQQSYRDAKKKPRQDASG